MKLGAFLYRHGEAFYNFQGLRAYKEKYNPVWEPHYLAYPGGLVAAAHPGRHLGPHRRRLHAHRAEMTGDRPPDRAGSQLAGVDHVAPPAAVARRVHHASKRGVTHTTHGSISPPASRSTT